jgi:hypothetical protein
VAGRLDGAAVLRGGGVALVIVGATMLVANLVDAVSDDGSPAALPLVLVALVGLAAGGWAAARVCHSAPLSHGAVAALAATAVLLAVNLGVQLARSEDVHWRYVVVWLLLALASGLVGALVALRTPARRADSPG